MKTWHCELLFAASLLSLVAILGGGEPVQWLSAFAVLVTFCHAQVSDRLDEAEQARPEGEATVHCRAWLTRYLVVKESAWVILFAYTGAYPALMGCFLFLGYPLWRRWWRG